MKIGLNLLLWTTHVDASHHGLLRDLRELGYDGVEVPVGQGDAEHFRGLGAFLDEVGLARTAVTSLAAETNAVSPDPKVRAAAVDHLRWAIDRTRDMGATLLCGPFHSAFKEFTGEPPTEAERARSAEVLRAAAEHAEEAGVTLALEALNRFECYLVNTMADLRALVRRVDHSSLGVHYDTHHMHIEERDVGAALEHVRDELVHVHVSENDRGVPGTGQVAWKDTFAALRRVGYDGWLTIESFSRLDAGFANAIHVWRDYGADPDTVAREGLAFLRGAWPA